MVAGGLFDSDYTIPIVNMKTGKFTVRTNVFVRDRDSSRV